MLSQVCLWVSLTNSTKCLIREGSMPFLLMSRTKSSVGPAAPDTIRLTRKLSTLLISSWWVAAPRWPSTVRRTDSTCTHQLGATQQAGSSSAADP